MTSLNPMFNRSNTKSRVNTEKAPKTNNNIKDRKKRSDAKIDVKIPFSDAERKMIKQQAKMKNSSPTQYVSNLLVVGLTRGKAFPIVSYSATHKKSIHAKLKPSDHQKLFDCSVEWDCSLREAAYRITSLMINMNIGGIINE